jgi:TonB-dependent receptor
MRFSTKIFLIIFLFISLKSYAATIKGNVTDKSTGEPLIGAVVRLSGTEYGATSGLDGSFSIANVPDGEYDLEMLYSSFETLKEHISVKRSTSIIFNKQLAPLAKALSGVEIKGKLRNGSDEQARNMEKNSMQTMNILSARSIELLPDITVANVLQRVSGIQVERDANGEARYASIRGMDKRYNYTMVNGVKIPSPDDKGRYVPLDLFPAEILDRVEVIKSLTPDMEGDAIGGVTNLVMKKAPDHFVIYASAATGYNQNLFDQHYNSFDKGAIVANDPTTIHGINYKASVADFPLGSSIVKPIQAPANDLFSLSLGNRFLKDKKLGVMFSGSYQNTFKETNNIFFAPASEPNIGNIDMFDDLDTRKYSTQETRSAIHTNIDYHFNDKNTISLYGLYVQMNQWQERNIVDTVITSINRPGPGLGTVDYKDRTTFTKQSIANITLKGEHIIAKGLKLDWTGAYSKATRDVPDWTEFNTEDNFTRDTSGKIKEAGRILKSVNKSWERTRDRDMQGFVNLSYTTAIFGKDVEFKAGGMYRQKTRDNYYNEYKLSPISVNIGGKIQGVPYTNVQNINDTSWNLSNTSPTGIAHANGRTYHETENITGYYAQAKLYLLDNKLEVLGGVRIEHTHVEDSADLDPAKTAQVAGKYDYTDLLPSVNLKYKLSKKQNVRLSYFESISRPGFFELVNYSQPSEVFPEYGNPQLNHSVAQNFDARYELFPKGIDQVLIGAFYKNIANPIEYYLIHTGTSAQGIQPQNLATNAINYGAEFVVTRYFHYFGVSANYTYTHSSITVPSTFVGVDPVKKTLQLYAVTETRPLQGQAAHIGNLSLLYKNPKAGFDANLSVQYTGRHITLASGFEGLDYWQKATTFLDFSCEKRIVKHVFVYAKVHNLLNSKTIVEMNESNKLFTNPGDLNNYLNYQNLKDGKTLVEQTQIGRNYLVGIRYKLD